MDGGAAAGGRSAGPLVAAVTAVGLLLLGLASIGAAILDRGARADAGPSDRIVFVTLDGRLAIIDPAGGEPIHVTPDRQRFSFPAWSPDGTRLAAIEVAEAGGSVVVAAGSGTGGPARLTSLHAQGGGVPIYLYWAPGGRQVSMLVPGAETLELLLAGADGRAPPARIATGQPLYWDWADTGRSLLVHTGLPGSGAMRLIDATGLERDAMFERPGIFQSPAVAASGRWFAYSVAGEGALGALVVADRSGRRRAALEQVGPVAFGWSPVGDRLAILAGGQAAPFPVGPLRLLDPTSGRLDVLVPGSILAFAWAPDGRSIAAIGLPDRDPGGVAGSPVTGAARTASAGVAGPPPGMRPPAAAPDELRLAVTVVDLRTLDTHLVATFRPTPLWVDQWLPFFDQYVKSHRLWSPRSDAIVLPVRTDDERSRIAVIPVDGSGERIIADGAMPAWSP